MRSARQQRIRHASTYGAPPNMWVRSLLLTSQLEIRSRAHRERSNLRQSRPYLLKGRARSAPLRCHQTASLAPTATAVAGVEHQKQTAASGDGAVCRTRVGCRRRPPQRSPRGTRKRSLLRRRRHPARESGIHTSAHRECPAWGRHRAHTGAICARHIRGVWKDIRHRSLLMSLTSYLYDAEPGQEVATVRLRDRAGCGDRVRSPRRSR